MRLFQGNLATLLARAQNNQCNALSAASFSPRQKKKKKGSNAQAVAFHLQPLHAMILGPHIQTQACHIAHDDGNPHVPRSWYAPFVLSFFFTSRSPNVPPTCGIGLPRKKAHEMSGWIETSQCLLECVQTLPRTIANDAAIIDESRPVQRPRRPRRRKRLESTHSHGDIQNTNGPCIQPSPTGYRVCTRFATTQQTRERERVKGLMKITTWPSGSHEQNGGQRSKNPS